MMFIAVKRNVLLPAKDWGRKKFLPRGYVGELEDEFTTPYFHALVKDGDIAVTQTTSDKEVVPEMEKPVKTRRKKG